MDHIIKEADFFLDISGYGLTSKGGLLSNIGHLLDIVTAKKYAIPYYIFPQSIGPFNFPMKYKFLLPLIALYLKYPRKIYVREKEGFQLVSKFSKNVAKGTDIVLQNREYNLLNIFRDGMKIKSFEIGNGSVGIIPNARVLKESQANDIYAIYNQIIERLIKAKKDVYLIRHSYEDIEICEKIKSYFPDKQNVVLVSDDLNAIELEDIISKFDFVIASRYHSIVQAYKKGVPALVIGWATKYPELLNDFGQLYYFFDARKKIDTLIIESKINKLINEYNEERTRICCSLNIVQSERSIISKMANR